MVEIKPQSVDHRANKSNQALTMKYKNDILLVKSYMLVVYFRVKVEAHVK